jgi:tetratricopeptide (TPR) repeat protein
MASERDRRGGPAGDRGGPPSRSDRPTGDRRGTRSGSGRRGSRSEAGGDGRRVNRDRRPPDAATGRQSTEGPGSRRRVSQEEYDGPPLPDSITGRELDRSVRDQLGSLPERLAIRVARHLVAAGQLMDSDGETAFAHARAARARASRVPAVREAYAELAYLTQRWEEALRELRTARRMTGRPDALPLIADCERALGRPERAVALGRDPQVERLDPAGRAEMAIVVAGARRDRGQVDAALGVLEAADLRTRSRAEWVARLRYAYADALLAAGRRAEALEWFHRAAGVDGQGSTDALERAEALQQELGDLQQ